MLLFVPQGSKTKGRTIRKREGFPSGEANIAKPFFDVGNRGAALNISQLISITCTFPGSLLAGGLALPGSKVSDDHRKLSDIYCTECPKKVDDAWINWEARICGHFGPFWSF